MDYLTQLEIVRYVQVALRSDFSDIFFTFWNYVDRKEFLFILIPTLWYGMHWKQGAKIFYILSLSALCNAFLKEFFSHPRPLIIDPTLQIIPIESAYGIPSGAAQTAFILSAILIKEWKSRWKWFVVVNFFIWMSFSRIYLAAHFPTDLVAGWTVGAALFTIYVYAFPRIEEWLRYRSIYGRVLISLAICSLFILPNTMSTREIIFAMLGISLGSGIMDHYQFYPSHFISKFQKMLGVAFAIVSFILLHMFLHAIYPSAFNFFFLGAWLSAGVSYTLKKLAQIKPLQSN